MGTRIVNCAARSALVLTVALSFLVGAGALAATTSVGDWTVEAFSGGGVASTSSSTGGELGILCSQTTAKCEFFIDSSSQCTNGATYPFLMNGPAGASDLVATCRVINTGGTPIDALVLAPFDTVEGALKTDGQVVGFAEPMENGAFRIYRFSTTGAASATNAASSAASVSNSDQTM